jgi:hypothetical protein
VATQKIPLGAWTPELADSKYCYSRVLRGEKRAFVFRPDCPLADKKGWVQRSRVVWWLDHNKQLPPDGFIIHHVNEDTLDDRPINLQAMSIPDHVKIHHQKGPPRIFRCKTCAVLFELPYHIYAERARKGCNEVDIYCSAKCYQKTFKGRKRKVKVA